MSPVDRLDVLRHRNKDLLNRLKQQREELERLGGCSRSRKRGREDEAEDRREPAGVLTGGHRGAALARPTVRFADTCARQTGASHDSTPALSSTCRRGTADHAAPSGLSRDRDRHPFTHSRLQRVDPSATKSCLVNHSKEQMGLKEPGHSAQSEVCSRVTFLPDECEGTSASDRHRLQPLLGYDWIAGVLDAEDSLIERSDEFFNDLHTFRSLNKDKINSRLFPVPLHAKECCPVCKEHKSSHPHTSAEPALIRVSIPRSTLLPPYKYKAHRRCSFDPSDSLGLPSHCLSGWSNTGQSTLPPPSSLDLRSSLHTKSSTESQDKELEELNAPKVSGKIADQIPEVSRLARHNFQHFSSKRKRGTMFYPLH
uniref:Migration and invasion inhibitory protein n=1 Tax=Gasterosteus aculeatus aculeatus TaxID=481459 RepID=G3NX49_GASAC